MQKVRKPEAIFFFSLFFFRNPTLDWGLFITRNAWDGSKWKSVLKNSVLSL